MCVSDPRERWPMADRSDATNLQRKRAFPNSFEKLNGANGMSDIEVKRRGHERVKLGSKRISNTES